MERKTRAPYWLHICCALLAVSGGCGHELSEQTLVGTWQGSYANGDSETYVFRPDRTFRQVLLRRGGIVYDNVGSWSIRNGDLVFKNWMPAFDMRGQPIEGTRPYDIAEVAWEGHGMSIIFSYAQTDYRIKKISEDTVFVPTGGEPEVHRSRG